MSEHRAIAEAVRSLRADGTSFVSATVVRVQGSSYRRPGARMIATETEWRAGSISAGCLERDVLTKGFWRTRSERAVLVTYSEAEDALDERRGSGCQGVIDYLVERWDPEPHAADPWQNLERCVRDDVSGVLVTVSRSTRAGVPVGARLWVGAEGCETSFDDPPLRAALEREARRVLAEPGRAYTTEVALGDAQIEALVEPVTPPPHIFIFGSGDDVTPVLTFAKHLGWTVSIWNAQPRISARERLRAADHYAVGPLNESETLARLARAPRPVALVMGHDLAQDQAVLAALVPSRAGYIGMLGPRRRTDQLIEGCRAQGLSVTERTLARIRGPVGLRIGAETPAEIALSILSEVQQWLAPPRERESTKPLAASHDAPELALGT
ncbi:MAG: XdhC family protein [Polyangiales bacterium]